MHLKNINQQAIDNTYFRQVLATSNHAQVVIMSIKPGEDIGLETHHENDQVLYLVSGNGQAILDGTQYEFETNDMVFVPAGVEHNFINTSDIPMKIITSYSPPHHAEGTVHKTKEEADSSH